VFVEIISTLKVVLDGKKVGVSIDLVELVIADVERGGATDVANDVRKPTLPLGRARLELFETVVPASPDISVPLPETRTGREVVMMLETALPVVTVAEGVEVGDPMKW
jgi:hypothetical protein